MSTVDELASPQFQELSHLAARYRVDLSRFRALRAKLDAADPDTKGVATVNLGAQLAAHDLLQPHRLQRLIAVPVQRDIEDFVRALCRALASTEDPRHASAKVGRHGICEYQVVHTVPELFSTAMIDAILHGGDDVSEITDGVVRALDALWAELCTPLVAAERHSLQADAPAVRKLAAFVLRLVQMLDNGRTAAGIFGVAKAEFTNLRHTIHRVVTDSWFSASEVPSAPLTDLRTAPTAPPADNEAAATAFVAWVRAHGARLHDALVSDATRMEALAATGEFATEWHGLCLRDEASDPSTSALVETPRFYGGFNTSTSRVYALPIAPNSCGPLRVLRTVRVLFVLRSLVVSGTLQLGRVSRSYASLLIAREIDVLVCKSSSLMGDLMALCADAGLPADDDALDAFVERLVRGDGSAGGDAARGSSSGSSSGAIASAAGALTAVALSTTSASPSVASTVAAAAARSGDFFVRPVAKSKSIPFTPSAVARSSLLEYTVLYSLMSLLENILAERRANMNHGVVGIAMSTVTDEVATMVMTMYRSEGALILKLVDGDASSSASLNVKMLRKLVVWTVRKVLKCGQDGCAAARRAEAPRATVFTAAVRGGQRSAQNAWLHIGTDASDPACFLFLDLLVRLKTHLDESWPLPEGVEWVAAKPRRVSAGPRREEDEGLGTAGAEDETGTGGT